MKSFKILFNFISLLFIFSGFLSCGYSTRSALPSHLRTIYIEPFKNKIAYTSETKRDVYLPLLEVKVKKAVVDRYLFDGRLKVAKEQKADLALKGELINFERSELRTSDNQDVEEYRITITVALELVDLIKNETKWTEPSFSGEKTYFVTGALAKSESEAVEETVKDLARRIVERTIEDW